VPLLLPLRAALPLLAALALCPLAALAIGDAPGPPLRRGEAIMALERSLGIAVEPAIHDWIRRDGTAMALAGIFYVIAHIGVAGWALVWTWCLRRDAFVRVRAAFLGAQLALVACYVAFPTAPPRLLPGGTFDDTLSSLWGREAADSAHAVQSAYASMPSGHVAFALVAGLTFARYGDRRWLRAFGVLYPPLVAAVVVATANHYVLDVAGGAVLAALVWAGTGGYPRPSSSRTETSRSTSSGCVRKFANVARRHVTSSTTAGAM
jgi:membrane-associated phospholipid phosphatase